MIKAEYKELDGKENGIVIKLINEEGFIKSAKGEEILFKNIETARTYLANVKCIFNPMDYEVYFKLGEEYTCCDNVAKYDGYYQYFTETHRYFISPKYNDIVHKLGYIVFENGAEKQCDIEYGKKRQKELYKEIKYAVDDMVKNSYYNPGISSVVKDDNGFLTLLVSNSTAKIHIGSNYLLIDLNQRRKEEGLRVLRYEKDVDKFLTFYSFITIDESESMRFKSFEKADFLLSTLIESLKIRIPESFPNYRGVDFYGNIELGGNTLW
jgi:hypothetical protein